LKKYHLQTLTALSSISNVFAAIGEFRKTFFLRFSVINFPQTKIQQLAFARFAVKQFLHQSLFFLQIYTKIFIN
jgi:hypothetical protein